MIINNLLFLFFAITNTLLEKKVCPKHTRTIYVYSYSLCFQGVNVFAIECIQQTMIINCYESLMSQIKKAFSILAKSEEFSMQLRHVNTLLDRKAARPALEFKLK